MASAIFLIGATALGAMVGGFQAAEKQKEACKEAAEWNSRTAQLQATDTQIINIESLKVQQYKEILGDDQSDMLESLLKYAAKRQELKKEYRKLEIIWTLLLSLGVILLTLKLFGFINFKVTRLQS